MDEFQAATEIESPTEIGMSAMDEADTDVLDTNEVDTDALDTGEVDTDVLDADEIDSADMGDLPVEDWDYQRPKRGQIRTGVILAIDKQEIIIDVGVKRDGVVPFADMQRMGDEALAELSVGEQVPVYILRPEDHDGNLLVSLFLARQERAWQRAQELADSDKVWEGEVIGYNKGGLVVPVGEIRGFVPASQVPGFPRGLNQEERLQRLSEMVGESLLVKVVEINRRNRRLILSASSAQREWREEARKRLLADLREGEVRTGSVSSLCPFGAFVDLGGADGLIHISELSWRRVRHPREVLKLGQKVEAYVLRLDHDRQRIGLSLKRLQPEPWALVEDRYELGQLIEGTVTNAVDFGAFAEVEEGIEGLIHISELTEGPISHPREVVKKGDLLLLRIIRIDVRRRRLGLSLKRVLESEWAEWAAQLAAAEELEKDKEPQAMEGDESAATAGMSLEEPSAPGLVEVPEAEAIQEPDASDEGQPEPMRDQPVEELASMAPEEESETKVSSAQPDAAPDESEVADIATIESPELAAVEA